MVVFGTLEDLRGESAVHEAVVVAIRGVHDVGAGGDGATVTEIMGETAEGARAPHILDDGDDNAVPRLERLLVVAARRSDTLRMIGPCAHDVRRLGGVSHPHHRDRHGRLTRRCH